MLTERTDSKEPFVNDSNLHCLLVSISFVLLVFMFSLNRGNRGRLLIMTNDS